MTFVAAQDDEESPKKTAEQRVDAQLAKIKEKIQLTDATIAKLRPIMLQSSKELEAVRKDKEKKGQAKVDALKAIISKQNAQVKPLLTADQFKKFEEWQNQLIEKMKEKADKKKKEKKG